MDTLKYIGMPLEKAKKELEDLGYNVEVIICSKPKIKTDSILVVAARKEGKNVQLVVGDFLIGVENGLV